MLRFNDGWGWAELYPASLRSSLSNSKAAKPTKDYDPRYDVAGWTKDQFVEAVYRSLTQTKR